MKKLTRKQTLNIKENVRKGWNEAFKQMRKNNDDVLLMDDVYEKETFEEFKRFAETIKIDEKFESLEEKN